MPEARAATALDMLDGLLEMPAYFGVVTVPSRGCDVNLEGAEWPIERRPGILRCAGRRMGVASPGLSWSVDRDGVYAVVAWNDEVAGDIIATWEPVVAWVGTTIQLDVL